MSEQRPREGRLTPQENTAESIQQKVWREAAQLVIRLLRSRRIRLEPTAIRSTESGHPHFYVAYPDDSGYIVRRCVLNCNYHGKP